MTKKIASTEVVIHELLASRWSPRAIAGQFVTREHLRQVLEAARWAPSSYNMQPWRFIVFDRSRDEAAFQRAFGTLVPFNQKWNRDVPVLICVTAKTLTAKGDANSTAHYDAGAAAMSLILQAHAIGLAAHEMSGFDSEAFRKVFSVPGDVDVIAMISLGHHGDSGELDEVLLARELAPRVRLPLGEIAFESSWREGFEQDYWSRES